jgi:hypothetical protein
MSRAEQNSGIHAPWVSCFDSSGHFAGPKDMRTETLSSPDGVHRAYAEIQAAAGGPVECENTVRLFISSNGAPFKPVFTQTPSVTTGTANSLGPVAWSPNGRWLAVEFGFWFYASDNGSLGLLLYDSRTGVASTPRVIEKIERALGKNCSLRLRSVVGIDPLNRVVLRVADSWDEEGRESFCIKETGDWLLDPATGRVQPLSVHGRAHTN